MGVVAVVARERFLRHGETVVTHNDSSWDDKKRLRAHARVEVMPYRPCGFARGNVFFRRATIGRVANVTCAEPHAKRGNGLFNTGYRVMVGNGDHAHIMLYGKGNQLGRGKGAI